MASRDFLEKFAKSERLESGCLIWSGRVDREGYARHSGMCAYRISYALHVGPIPEGMTIDHLCFDGRCVEPSHLRVLSNLANARNRRKSGRRVVPDDECINGHEYSAENTYVMPNGRRDCRACIRSRVRAYRLRRIAA